MRFGYKRTASATPLIKVADCRYNTDRIYEIIESADKKRTDIIVFPELCITGYTCGDLFLQKTLLDAAQEELVKLAERTRETDMVVAVGFPFSYNGRLYNTAAVLHKGKILGIVPKTYLPNYAEFYEKRYFSAPLGQNIIVTINGQDVPFGTRLLFCDRSDADLVLAVEICEDLWAAIPPSSFHAQAGATVLVNLSASNEITGKDTYRRDLVKSQSARLLSAYIYSSAGVGESTTDLVYSGHNLICENGQLLSEAERFKNQTIYADIDVQYLCGERRRSHSASAGGCDDGYERVYFDMKEKDSVLERKIHPAPFIPADTGELSKRCDEILTIQAMGLVKRIEYTGVSCVVINVSGGLDSTLALLVTVKAFDMLGLDRKGIKTITIPCFGTTDKTYNNAMTLMNYLNTDIMEIDMRESVLKHFADIGHNPDVHDLTYENAQARERTQIAMDVASMKSGFVIGTGDLSEMALGFTTYNGDHMSMYGVNSSVPKTLIRHMIKHIADSAGDEILRNVLTDILNTPVSPELLPPVDGVIAQVTEDIVGPYELHDFFLYYMMRLGYGPEKIMYLAVHAFSGKYDRDVILKWLEVFIKRFFSQQYKRSCVPDGPKVGSVALSPRGDWRMPSDAAAGLWLEQVKRMKTSTD